MRQRDEQEHTGRDREDEQGSEQYGDHVIYVAG
jgi:hypothetical protein